MTKEFEERKKDGPPSKAFTTFEVIVTILVCIIGALFLLMVIFPQGGWVEIFTGNRVFK
ncbi:MAG: hypothetical protein IKH33_04905 [Bacteroidales bacterium]|nr:hypothetical protein [Bacteroidales bacterium]